MEYGICTVFIFMITSFCNLSAMYYIVLYNLHLHPTDGTAKPQCHNDRLLDQQLDSLI